jgi:[ribosomal protein S5]-alanine N-acetyltransferase
LTCVVNGYRAVGAATILQVSTLRPGYVIRPLEAADAPALSDAQQRNREHLGPWSPRRGDAFFTLEGQEAELDRHLAAIASGQLASYVVVAADGRIVGRVNLNSIIRGAFHSADLGYWVDKDEVNKGLMTAAVEHVCGDAEQIGLHRVGAATLVHNEPSQRVLRRCGFSQIGMAPEYLFIDDAWQDHNLYQRILHDRPLDLD